LEQNIKAYVKNLSEVFWFIHQFAVLGKDEACITKRIVVIDVTSVSNHWRRNFLSFKHP